MFRMEKPFEIHVVRSDGTGYTRSWHRTSKAALRALKAYLKPRGYENPTHTPRLVQVWCAADNKSHDLEALEWHVKYDTYL